MVDLDDFEGDESRDEDDPDRDEAAGRCEECETWGEFQCRLRLDAGYHSTEERRREVRTGVLQRLSQRQRLSTPAEFRDLLLALARTARAVEVTCAE